MGLCGVYMECSVSKASKVVHGKGSPVIFGLLVTNGMLLQVANVAAMDPGVFEYYFGNDDSRK